MRHTIWMLPTRTLADAATARAAWRAVLNELRGVRAVCVLPSAVQVVHEASVPTPLPPMSAEPLGRMQRSLHDASALAEAVHQVHTAPCAEGLVDDPLAWPWSTARDVAGLALPCVVPRYGLRPPLDPVGRPPPRVALDAVSALTRTWLEALGQPPYPRALAIHTLRTLRVKDSAIERLLGVGVPRRRAFHVRPADLELVWAVAGDPRFGPLRHPSAAPTAPAR